MALFLEVVVLAIGVGVLAAAAQPSWFVSRGRVLLLFSFGVTSMGMIVGDLVDRGCGPRLAVLLFAALVIGPIALVRHVCPWSFGVRTVAGQDSDQTAEEVPGASAGAAEKEALLRALTKDREAIERNARRR